DRVANRQEVALNPVELLRWQADRRKDRLAVGIAILPDNDVAAPKIFKVVREGAQRPDDGIGIPARLVFDPIAFDGSLSQQVIDIDRKFADHCRPPCLWSMPTMWSVGGVVWKVIFCFLA